MQINNGHSPKANQCRLEQFIDCFDNARSYNKTCEKNCSDSCNIFSYSLSVYHSEQFTGGEIRIHISVANYDTLVFEEMHTWNIQTFLGAFGGALSLWLGLDCMNVLRFVAATIAYLYSKMSTSKLIKAFR